MGLLCCLENKNEGEEPDKQEGEDVGGEALDEPLFEIINPGEPVRLVGKTGVNFQVTLVLPQVIRRQDVHQVQVHRLNVVKHKVEDIYVLVEHLFQDEIYVVLVYESGLGLLVQLALVLASNQIYPSL